MKTRSHGETFKKSMLTWPVGGAVGSGCTS